MLAICQALGIWVLLTLTILTALATLTTGVLAELLTALLPLPLLTALTLLALLPLLALLALLTGIIEFILQRLETFIREALLLAQSFLQPFHRLLTGALLPALPALGHLHIFHHASQLV